MSEDKGGEYTKRLSQELKSSLYQRGDPDQQLWNGDMAPPDLQVSVCCASRGGLGSEFGFESGWVSAKILFPGLCMMFDFLRK